MFHPVLNSPEQFSAFGRNLLMTHLDEVVSFNAVAQQVVEDFDQLFRSPTDEPLFSLIRIFRFCSYTDVPAIWQSQSTERDVWLVLAGTTGENPQWRVAAQSVAHKSISLRHESSGMMAEAFRQLGVIPQITHESPELVKQLYSADLRYFYVREALGCPYIPSQEDFIKPYGIRSVVGMGSQFISGAAFMLSALLRRSSAKLRQKPLLL